ncbi:PREDICTED: reverse mRNAase [Prunus dulcis]|uniref:PREDICTED: reverse mRNAase n=1 Tax=Prunus dulcis TaxID=3755 RepID=A0A5E4FLM2_PRUDU|nr:PREDICTED: reverse mRNAase [Prunus dulcis]
MVTKQSWRLRENPSSLVARILKARYFPHANFLDAMLGSSPSLDKWIPKPITFRPLLNKGLNGEAMVADLIMPSRKWDLQLLEQALCAEDCEVVSSISLGTVAQLDKYWFFTRMGNIQSNLAIMWLRGNVRKCVVLVLVFPILGPNM